MKSKAGILVLFLLIQINANAQVPPEWDTAYAELSYKLNSIYDAVFEKWDQQPWCSDFGGNIMLANSNRGYALFTPDTNYPFPIPAYQEVLYAYIDTMLMALDTLGYNTIDLTIQYPVLVSSFINNEYYLDFYKNVATRIRDKGFKMIIGCQATFVDSVFGEPRLAGDIRRHYFNPDNNPNTNDTLNNTRFKQEKLQMLQTIIDSIKPDYLTMEMEPQTQAYNLLYTVDYSLDSALAFIDYYLENLEPGETLLGAGAGTWDDIAFFTGFAEKDIDYLDYHIYPPHWNYIDNKVFLIDSIADAGNKLIIIGEAWCYKATHFELLNSEIPVASSYKFFQRDVFDFWTEIDTLFVKAIIMLSQQSKTELVNFFWPNIMFGQIEYDQEIFGAMTPKQIIDTGSLFGYLNMYRFRLSEAGKYAREAMEEVCLITGVHEGSHQIVPVFYPNPFQEVVYFNYSRLPDNYVVNVYSIDGTHFVCARNPQKLNLGFLRKGIYLLCISAENTKGIWKLLKN